MTTTYSTKNSGPFGGEIQPNYPKNCWWVAASAADITREPYACWMLDLPVVLYRKEDGSPVALDNRCPHRWAPLSSGYLEGDNIVCGYHGLQFNSAGTCVNVPSQDNIPGKACVRAYPVMEKYSFIWVWLGDPEKAALEQPPEELAWLDDPNVSRVQGTTLLDGNYMMLKENVLDLTHFGFVHKNSIKVTDWDKPPKVETTDKTVTYVQEFPDTPLSFIYGVPTGIGMEKPVYRKNWGSYITPAVNVGALVIHDPQPEPGARSDFRFNVAHLTTPVSPTKSRYWWIQGWDIKLDDDYLAKWQPAVEMGYGEDKDIIDAVQGVVSNDVRGSNYPEVLLIADQAAIQARRKLQDALSKEQDAQ